MSPGVAYLLGRLHELEQGMARAAEEIAARDATIAELKKARVKPKKK